MRVFADRDEGRGTPREEIGHDADAAERTPRDVFWNGEHLSAGQEDLCDAVGRGGARGGTGHESGFRSIDPVRSGTPSGSGWMGQRPHGGGSGNEGACGGVSLVDVDFAAAVPAVTSGRAWGRARGDTTAPREGPKGELRLSSRQRGQSTFANAAPRAARGVAATAHASVCPNSTHSTAGADGSASRWPSP